MGTPATAEYADESIGAFTSMDTASIRPEQIKSSSICGFEPLVSSLILTPYSLRILNRAGKFFRPVGSPPVTVTPSIHLLRLDKLRQISSSGYSSKEPGSNTSAGLWHAGQR